MATEFFLVPVIGTGPRTDPWRPKYWHVPEATAGNWWRYSKASTALATIEAPQAYLDSVAAQPDAFRLCALENLNDNILGPASVAIRNWLESLNIPATNWISAADSYRQVIRVIDGIFAFSSKYECIHKVGFFEGLEAAGFGLNTQWQDLSQVFRDTIQATIDAHGWPDQPAPNDQVRKLLKDFSEKFEGLPMLTARGVEI